MTDAQIVLLPAPSLWRIVFNRMPLMVVLLSVALGGCSTLVAPPSASPPAAPSARPSSDQDTGRPGPLAARAMTSAATEAAVAQAAWARVLDRYVEPRGHVDFQGLANSRADLDRYADYVARTPLSGFADPMSRLAHMINAYNALSMYNVIASEFPESHAGLRKVNFFVLRKLVVGGEAMSLYSFENDIIRPLANSLGLPEVHFALNCSAVSCPVLPRRPFEPTALAGQLQREAKLFFARPENFRVDHVARTVWLNEILGFYTPDFVPGHGRNLVEYANRHAPEPAPIDYEVCFEPYDWTVAHWHRR